MYSIRVKADHIMWIEIFEKVIMPKHLKWIIKCPIVTSHLLQNKLFQLGRGWDEPNITVLFHLTTSIINVAINLGYGYYQLISDSRHQTNRKLFFWDFLVTMSIIEAFLWEIFSQLKWEILFSIVKKQAIMLCNLNVT